MSSPVPEPVSVLVDTPKNQSECIAWACKHLCIFEEVDEDIVGIVAKIVEEDDDDEDIAQFQCNYNKKVTKRRHELLVECEEAAMKKKQEDLAKMKELFPAIAEEMEKLKSSQLVLVPATQPATSPSPIPFPIPSTSASKVKPKPKPKLVLKKTTTVTTRPVVMRRMLAMSHTPISRKKAAAPAPKPSSSCERTIDLIEEDELEEDVKIVPAKKAKFVPPIVTPSQKFSIISTIFPHIF
ncbi:hypothetical protein Clacol_009724 [Clathrus columnatus]|uniref:Uncharacterized protein n=1 Tax=Clathrus columnatus TaxID=1419009 RepID=A0AAV5ARH2_9AGAM|nr:hypothetical protein Clacol_009724 [Clathrus columnatus]